MDDTLEYYLRSLETFGAVPAASAQVDRMTASDTAAYNLLRKARRWWHEDRERALGYVERAVRLSDESVDSAGPAHKGAVGLLYNEVLDAAVKDDDSLRWFDTALATMATALPAAQVTMVIALVSLSRDHDLLCAADTQRIFQAMRGIPVNDDRLDDHAAVVGVLDLCEAYAAALDRTEAEPTNDELATIDGLSSGSFSA